MNNYQSQIDIDSQNESYDQQSDSLPQNLMGSQIQELFRARQRLKDFIKSLGDLKSSPILKTILEYYTKVNERVLTPENVIRMNEKRVEKMLKNKKIKKNWSNQDVNILIWVLSKYMQKTHIKKIDDLNNKDWKLISELIPGSTGDRCMFKWLSLKKFNLAAYKWEQNESSILSQLVNDNGIKDWKYISQRLYKLNPNQNKIFRNAKQCRQHWSCYLNPKLKKGPWQVNQDKKLLQCILNNNGLKKWSQIARKFHGRTQNALKNRYNLVMQKLKRTYKHKDQIALIREQYERMCKNCDQQQDEQKIIREKYEQSREIQHQSQKRQIQNNDDQIYDDEQQINHHYSHKNKNKKQKRYEKQKQNIYYTSNCSTKNGQGFTPIEGHNPRVVKANYNQILSLLNQVNNHDGQLVPAVMTNNNQFHINTIYHVPYNLNFMQ